MNVALQIAGKLNDTLRGKILHRKLELDQIVINYGTIVYTLYYFPRQ